MPYNWTYGIALSGVQFPLVTASGTLATGYDTAQLSGSISQNGMNWSGLTNSISGIPGGGVYSIASLTVNEMACYTWAIKITANSGCLDQILLGVNASSGVFVSGLTNVLVAASGPHYLTAGDMATVVSSVWNYAGTTSSRYITGGTVDATASITAADKAEITSSIWNYTAGISGRWVTGGILNRVENVSGTVTLVPQIVQVSGLGSILTAVSGTPAGVWTQPTRTIDRVDAVSGRVTLEATTHSGAILNQIVPVSGLANILSACSGIPTGVWTEPTKTSISSIAQQTWNTVTTDFTSGTTFGGGPQRVSGLINILTATSNLTNNVSGLPGILTAISSVPTGVRDVDTRTENTLTSGTIGHDLMQLRYISCENLYIDKTYTPDRLYVKSSGANLSSYFTLTDDANSTIRTRTG